MLEVGLNQIDEVRTSGDDARRSRSLSRRRWCGRNTNVAFLASPDRGDDAV